MLRMYNNNTDKCNTENQSVQIALFRIVIAFKIPYDVVEFYEPYGE